MLKASTETRGDILKALTDADKAKPKLFRKLLQQRLSQFGSKFLGVLRAEKVGPPSYPFIWSNSAPIQEKVRRWYFANKVPKGSKGGVYKPTGKLAQSWKTRLNLEEMGGLVELENTMPGAEFVVGSRQAPGHQGRHKRIDQWAEEASEELDDVLVDTWFEITEK